MRLRAKGNIDEVERSFDDFAARIAAVAMPRALVTLRDQAEVAGVRKVQDEYQIKAKDIRDFETVGLDAQALEASIAVKGRGFPLSAFHPVQVPGKGGGVRVAVKGKTFIIAHAFKVKRFGDHVFARGSYGGKAGGVPTGEAFGRFQFSKTRLPISELYTFGPAEAFSNPDVTQAMNDRIDEQAPKVLAREIKAVARGF